MIHGVMYEFMVHLRTDYVQVMVSSGMYVAMHRRICYLTHYICVLAIVHYTCITSVVSGIWSIYAIMSVVVTGTFACTKCYMVIPRCKWIHRDIPGPHS